MFDAHAHIEDYLLGKLDAKKKTQFEEALKKDKVLQKIVEDYATYVPVADHFIYQDLKQLVRKERKLLNRKKIVLSILGLAGLGFLILLFSIFNKPKHEKDQFAKLFEKHYNSPMLDQERGSENNSTKDLCHEAHIELDKLETTIAKRLFDAALTEYKPNEFCYEKALYYLTLISVKQKNTNEASEYFKQLELLPPNNYLKEVEDLKLDLENLK